MKKLLSGLLLSLISFGLSNAVEEYNFRSIGIMPPLCPLYKNDRLSYSFEKYLIVHKKESTVEEVHEKYYSMKQLFKLIEEDRYFEKMALSRKG